MDFVLKSESREDGVIVGYPALGNQVLRPDPEFPTHFPAASEHVSSNVPPVSSEIDDASGSCSNSSTHVFSEAGVLNTEEQLLLNHLDQLAPASYMQSEDTTLYCCNYPGCGQILESFKSLTKHKTTHKGVHLTCNTPNCGKTFTTRSGLKLHQRYHCTGIRQFHCPHQGCDRTFFKEYHLQLHQRVHSNCRTVPCDYPGCSVLFSSQSSMLRHKEVRHLVMQPRPRIVCTHPGCGNTFASVKSLRVHLNLHSRQRVYICDFPGCGHKFLHYQSLTRHKQTHKNKQDRLRYRCRYPSCDAAYICQAILMKHERRIHGAPLIKCRFPGCSKEFFTSSKRSIHHKMHLRQQARETASTIHEFNQQLVSTSITLEPMNELEFPMSLAGLCTRLIPSVDQQ